MHITDRLHAGTELIKASESVRNIGVWFDKTLLMKKHINSVCKTAFYQVRHLATIRRFLSYQHFEILIHAFVTSRLDYCNSLLSGLPQNLFQKLQYVQYSAARLLSLRRLNTLLRYLKNSTDCLLLSELNLRS